MSWRGRPALFALPLFLGACSGGSAVVSNRASIQTPSPTMSSVSQDPSGSYGAARTQGTLAGELKSLCPREDAGSPQAIWCTDNDGHTAFVHIYRSHAEMLS